VNVFISAENDPRVASWLSSKFAATLQKANTSPRPILLDHTPRRRAWCHFFVQSARGQHGRRV
jgi:hypothetical protein